MNTTMKTRTAYSNSHLACTYKFYKVCNPNTNGNKIMHTKHADLGALSQNHKTTVIVNLYIYIYIYIYIYVCVCVCVCVCVQ